MLFKVTERLMQCFTIFFLSQDFVNVAIDSWIPQTTFKFVGHASLHFYDVCSNQTLNHRLFGFSDAFRDMIRLCKTIAILLHVVIFCCTQSFASEGISFGQLWLFSLCHIIHIFANIQDNFIFIDDDLVKLKVRMLFWYYRFIFCSMSLNI